MAAVIPGIVAAAASVADSPPAEVALNVQTAAAPGTGVTSLTISSYAIPPGSNRVLVVTSGGRRNGASPVASAAYNGVPLPQAAQRPQLDGSNHTHSAIFYMLEADFPATGDIVVSYDSGGCNDAAIKAFVLTGRSQHVPESAATNGANGALQLDSLLNAITAAAVCVDHISAPPSETMTPDSGQEIISHTLNDTTTNAASYKITAGASEAVAFDWSWTTQRRVAWVGAAFAPASGSRTAADVFGEALAWWEADFASNDVDAGPPVTITRLKDKNLDPDAEVAEGVSFAPQRVDTAGIISAEYNATDTNLQGDGSPVNGFMNAGGTSIHVVRPDSDGESSFGRVWSAADGSSDVENLFSQGESAGNLAYRLTANYTTTNGDYVTAVAYPVGQVHVIVVRHDKANPTALKMRINGSDLTIGSGITQNSAPAGTPTNPTAFFNIGNRFGKARTWDGGHYLHAFWDSILSDADVDLIVAYAAAKYQP